MTTTELLISAFFKGSHKSETERMEIGKKLVAWAEESKRNGVDVDKDAKLIADIVAPCPAGKP